ncbi:MAG: diaminopimelate epimerase [Armatimonadetes bacterium]|nr:diaminopimelate epimerase [Armatimonadota bacterium]
MRRSHRSIPFTKMQGAGNDFVVVDGRGVRGVDWSSLAPEMCDRHTGIGSDGLLVVDGARRADAAMRMYNPDGTPDVCGNGLRCIARFIAERDPEAMERARQGLLRICTMAGVRQAQLLPTPEGLRVGVTMGKPVFEPGRVPVMAPGPRVLDYDLETAAGPITISALSTGSTHAVTFVDQLPDDSRFGAVSPLVERHAVFPARTSVMWARVMDRSTIHVRIWERGVGETLACGTGACAAAVSAILRGDADGAVDVVSRGGVIHVEWAPGGAMRQTGGAETVFEGVYTT